MLTYERLHQENLYFGATGGVSLNNLSLGFLSAFFDTATGYVYLSRFADGRLAQVHVLEGLPDELIAQRDSEGRVTAIKPTVIAGFLHAGNFYTREQAAQLVSQLAS